MIASISINVLFNRLTKFSSTYNLIIFLKIDLKYSVYLMFWNHAALNILISKSRKMNWISGIKQTVLMCRFLYWCFDWYLCIDQSNCFICILIHKWKGNFPFEFCEFSLHWKYFASQNAVEFADMHLSLIFSCVQNYIWFK